MLAVREAQRVERREEEKVEEARAPDRDPDRIGATEQNRHRKNGKQVEDAQAEHGHERLADVDEPVVIVSAAAESNADRRRLVGEVPSNRSTSAKTLTGEM